MGIGILGIDPGKGGGIAHVGFVPGASMQVVKMPETIGDLVGFLSGIRRDQADRVVVWIEDVQPGGLNRTNEGVGEGPIRVMGAKSAFTFGHNVGVLHGVCMALGYEVRRVRPAAWQKAMGCLTRGDKNISKAEAQRRFPWVGRITHATADALLICEFGRIELLRETESKRDPESPPSPA